MPQLFSRRANLRVRAALLFAGTLLVVPPLVAWAWVRTPVITRQYVRVAQPIPFSHALHANALRIDCRYCHAGAERGPSAGLPPTSACVPCHHDGLFASRLFDPVRLSLSTGTPIPWTRVTGVPDFVFFDHAAHVRNGVACETCHGPVQQMREVYQAAPLTMEWCVDCHRRPETAFDTAADVRSLTSCTTCHR
jgi:hypothetical protein